MTATNRNPNNQNFLQPNKFIINFARAPSIQYFCQSVSVPGISLSEIPQNTPFVDVYVPGEKAIYDLLNITFLIDEELKGLKKVNLSGEVTTRLKQSIIAVNGSREKKDIRDFVDNFLLASASISAIVFSNLFCSIWFLEKKV